MLYTWNLNNGGKRSLRSWGTGKRGWGGGILVIYGNTVKLQQYLVVQNSTHSLSRGFCGLDRIQVPCFPGGSDGKESACNTGDLGSFNPWVGKIPWKRAWHSTPVFLPGESPWTEEPGGPQSIGSHRVGHDWSSARMPHLFRGASHLQSTEKARPWQVELELSCFLLQVIHSLLIVYFFYIDWTMEGKHHLHYI